MLKILIELTEFKWSMKQSRWCFQLLNTIYRIDKRLFLLALLTFFQVTSMVMMRQLTPLYLESTGATPGIIGLAASLFAFLPLLISLPGGVFMDVLGYRLVLLLGSSCTIAAAVTLITLPAVNIVMLTQIIAGLGHLLIILSGQAYLSRISSDAERSRNMAIFFTGPTSGFLVGPPVAGFLQDIGGFSMGYWGVILVSLLVLIMVFQIQELPSLQDRSKTITQLFQEQFSGIGDSISRLVQSSEARLSMSISTIALFVLTLRTSFLLVHLQHLGLSAFHIGLIVATIPITALMIRPFLGRLVDWVGTHRLLTIAFLTGGAGILVMAFTQNLIALFLTAFLFGITPTFSQPVSLIFMAEAAEEDKQGMAMGLRQTANRLGLLSGPLMFGVIAGQFGTQGCLIVAAIVFFATAGVLYRSRGVA